MLVIQEFLGSASATTVGTTAAEILTSPAEGTNKRKRTGFQITNCDDAGAVLYVANDSAVSATNYVYELAVGEMQYVPWNANVRVYIIASAASTNYRVQEVIAALHPGD